VRFIEPMIALAVKKLPGGPELHIYAFDLLTLRGESLTRELEDSASFPI
jgi:hypothetical protein